MRATPVSTAREAAPIADRPDPSAPAGNDTPPVGPRLAPVAGKRRLPTRIRARRWLATVAIVLALLAVTETWLHTRTTPPVRYATDAISRGTVARAVTGSGTVNPVTTVQVGTYVSGVIQKLFCDYNTRVTKGQLCATIDPRPYQTVVDQGQANLSTARAQLVKDQTNLTYAKLTYQRNLDLLQRGIVTQDAADSARSAADQAQAQVELDQSTIDQHQALLKAAQINLGYTNIVSPVNGTVVSRNVTMGQTVAASFQTPTLFLIATDLTNMQVDANVSESDIGGVSIGEPTSFTVEAFPDHVFHGTVTQVRQAPQSVQNVITYDVVINAPNPDLLLKPGMTATTRIVTDHRDNVVRVPDQALRYMPGGLPGAAAATAPTASGAPNAGSDGGTAHVWILRDGRPVEIAVTIGLDDDTNAEVAAGNLAPGDRVIVSEQSGNRTPGGSQPAPRFFRI
jgi:HlyD family secretion protein